MLRDGVDILKEKGEVEETGFARKLVIEHEEEGMEQKWR